MVKDESQISSLKAKADKRRTLSEKIADWLTNAFGSVLFLTLNAIWFIVWIAINTGLIPRIVPFDPFPFGLLTMILSIEAIFLAIFVLISQNRAAKVADLREETDLQINEISEKEITKVIKMLSVLLKKSGVDISKDPELKEMIKSVDPDILEEKIESQLSS